MKTLLNIDGNKDKLSEFFFGVVLKMQNGANDFL